MSGPPEVEEQGFWREVDIDKLEAKWKRENRMIEEQDGNRYSRRVPRKCVEVVTMDEKTDVSRRTEE